MVSFYIETIEEMMSYRIDREVTLTLTVRLACAGGIYNHPGRQKPQFREKPFGNVATD